MFLWIALQPPNCSTDALTVYSTEININFGRCSFEKGTTHADVIYNNIPHRQNNLQGSIRLTDLTPGQQIKINIVAYGHNNKPSHAIKFTQYTRKIYVYNSLILYFLSSILIHTLQYSSLQCAGENRSKNNRINWIAQWKCS